MRIDIEQLKDEGSVTVSSSLNFAGRETHDVLIESVEEVKATATALMIEAGEYHVSVDYTAHVKYLDARNLNPLDLTFDFHEDIIFSSDFQKAEEFELEYFEGDEIVLDELLFALTCVSIPLNYSEDESGSIKKESDSQFENKPFADIFNK
ncbi:hypothetical protein RZE82_05725 [Mollicutes bacterium LVI A0039]|nr:hypothetical protein RZE82_05725 [Mollicutes bacterium LVI A0039]